MSEETSSGTLTEQGLIDALQDQTDAISTVIHNEVSRLLSGLGSTPISWGAVMVQEYFGKQDFDGDGRVFGWTFLVDADLEIYPPMVRDIVKQEFFPQPEEFPPPDGYYDLHGDNYTGPDLLDAETYVLGHPNLVLKAASAFIFDVTLPP